MTVVSVDEVDGSLREFVRPHLPVVGEVDGLAWSGRRTAAQFTGTLVTVPQLTRNAAICFWRDQESCDAWHGTGLGRRWQRGWSISSHVLRAIGSWPGLADEIPRGVGPMADGPVVGLTIGPLRLRRAVEFFRLNTPTEQQLLEAPGLIWASGFSAIPLHLVTMTVWESESAMAAFIRRGAHAAAMAATNEPGFDPALPNGNRFFGQNCTMRLLPYHSTGELLGKNPMPGL